MDRSAEDMFHQSTFSMSNELLTDWLIVLSQENEARMNIVQPQQVVRDLSTLLVFETFDFLDIFGLN